MSEALVTAWAEAIHSAFMLARAERAAQLRGDHKFKRFDNRGLHPYSVEWGRVFQIEALLPGLAELRDVGPPCDPWTLRREAEAAAEEAFVAELIDTQGAGSFGMESS